MEEYNRRKMEFETALEEKKYAGLTFSALEEQANNLYRDVLVAERATKDDNFFKVHTLKHLPEIVEHSKIYEAVKRLPKGAVLHIHIDCCLDIDWFMSELAYHENSYFHPEKKQFKYFNSVESVEAGFKSLIAERAASEDPAKFDTNIRNILYIHEEERTDLTNNIWQAFEQKVMATGGLIYYEHHFKKYLKRYLQNFIDDGVLHIEARAFLNSIFLADGSKMPIEEEVELINQVVRELQVDHPHFTFLVVIQGLKMWDLDFIVEYMKEALEAKKRFPDLICGFDLVQEEDAFKTLNELAPALIQMKSLEEEAGVKLPFVLHSGESLHSIKNTNLYDAIMLGTKRIGHGINLSQHSCLLERIREDEICLEVCPVSNQVLKYVDDIRLHPIKTFLNYGIKVCINPDDPGFFGYNGVTPDFYFVTIGTQFDYKDFKLCAYNSIKYSFLAEEKKASTWAEVERRFEEWCQWFIKTNSPAVNSQ